MHSEFASSYCKLDEISLFSACDSLQSKPLSPELNRKDPSTDDSLFQGFPFACNSPARKPNNLNELFLEPDSQITQETPDLPHNLDQARPKVLGFLENEQIIKSQTETKLDSKDISEESLPSTREVKRGLSKLNELTFDYLNSGKVFDPKHLPIEDKGKVYYYQDDPVLYKRVKK